MEFLDRVDERRRLLRFVREAEGGVACVYGRRRIGKSRLLDEVLEGKENVVFYCADRSEAALQRARMAKDVSRMLSGFADVVYSEWRSFFERWQREAPRGSVLVIDELPYLVERSPELPSILQKITDNLRKTGQKLVLCGSSQRMMQGLVMDVSEPLYGRCRVILKLAPIGYPWLRKAFPASSRMGRLEHYAVWGGVPRYWEVCQGEHDFWETIRDEVFAPNGLFHEEPSFVLKDDLEGLAQAASVLSLIGQGAERPSEMAGRLQVPQTALARPLKRLLALDLIRREVPFGADVKSGKKALYKLADPFLNFWYSFVLPHYSDPQFLLSAEGTKAMELPFRVYLGQVWEELVRTTLQEKPLPGSAVRWRKVARWWGTGLNRQPLEVDLVAESSDGKTLLVGETKLKQTKLEIEHVLAELKVKAKLLPFYAQYEKVVCRLFIAESTRAGEVTLGWVEGDDVHQ